MLLAVASPLAAAAPRTFHVDSARGDDAGDGLAPDRAWSSLDRVNRTPLAPGDRVLFRRGGTWRGQLRPQSGARGAVITYAAYGEGAKPLILGSAPMNRPEDWQPAGPGLWSTAPLSLSATSPLADFRSATWGLHTEAGAAATLEPLSPDADGRGGFRLICRQPGKTGNHLQVSVPLVWIARPGSSALLAAAFKSSHPTQPLRASIMTARPPFITYGTNADELTVGPGTAWIENLIHLPLQPVTDDARPMRFTFFLGGALPAGTVLECRFGLLTAVDYNQPIPLVVDVGNIIFDDGAAVGVKKWSREELKRDGDFWYDPQARCVILRAPANPGTRHRRIEFALNRHIIAEADRSHVTYEGLALSLGAAHGIGGGNTSHITVRDCDISWIGGGRLKEQNGQPVRFGNGVEFWSAARDCLVEDCRIWEIYDAALTNQGDGVNEQVNIVFRRNVVWNSEYSFEFWNRGPESKTRGIRFEHNTCVDAGYGWGYTQRPNPDGRHLKLGHNTSQTGDFIVRYNIFSRARDSLVRLVGRDWLATLTLNDNVWHQPTGTWWVFGKETLSGPAALAFLHRRGLDTRSLFADPGFLDSSRRDYRLHSASPARQLPNAAAPAGAQP